MKLNANQNTLKPRLLTESKHNNQICYYSLCQDIDATRKGSEILPGREKLFNKVVTQSDIKYYRLAIPKHEAKKHFPLHFSSSSKGASLCMEDNEGKIWNFRFSFWKSCQGYMITQEWNQFVKDKRLRAGDTVSFLRSTGPEKRFYIDFELQRGLIMKTKRGPFEPTQKSQALKLFGVVISPA